MYAIDDSSAVTSMPAPEAVGTAGWFTEGNPATGVPATLVRASFLNGLQQELLNVLSAGGITPSKTTYNQLLAAIQALYGSGRPGHTFTSNDWVPLAGGAILQWGGGSAGSTSAGNVVGFPIAFPNACLSVTASDSGNQIYSYGCGSYTKTSFTLFGGVPSSGGPTYLSGGARYFAIGF